jgi:hypothetical protein
MPWIFIKKLFGEEAKKNIRLSENFWSADEKVFSEENEALEAKLYEDEIRKAIFESYVEGAPAQMGSLSSSTKNSVMLLK